MLKLIFLAFIFFNLEALDISLQGAKENYQNYSTLHIKDNNKFLCQEIKNNFSEITKIVCAFSKSPSKKLKTLQNDFFKIQTQTKNKTFFLIITPYKKMKLYPIVFNLSTDDTIFNADAKLSKHWMIIGYNKDIPYIKKNQYSEVAINFPFYLDSDKLPFVGSLDIKGNPVYIQEVRDVSDYLKIKRYYKEKKYEKCLELIDELMTDFPSSLFNAELLYYKIRANAKLDMSDEVMDLSKIFLREYSSDEHVAEILSLLARAYYLEGLSSQADYFFDRLFDEHKDSKYAKWGYIYKGEMLEESGASTKALDYYKKALNDTNEVEIAATAAFKLARYKINNGNKKDASKYILKIVNAMPSFFVSQYKISMDVMNSFADEGEFFSAAAIAKTILDEINTDNDDYESLMKNRAVWLSKTDNKQDALKALNEYLKVFPDGMFLSEIEAVKDALFFDVKDANLSTRLKSYDELIQKYNEDSIGNRAVYEKAKLMCDNGMYEEVLEFKDKLLALDSTIYPDTNKIVNDAALGVMENGLKNNRCQKVLEISNRYAITLSDNWDDGIYKCAMKGADFTLAKKITAKNLQSKNLKMRKKWLYRFIKVDFATGNYSEVIKASQDLIMLMQNDKNSPYIDIYRVLFDTYQRLENNNKMVEIISKIEKVFGISYKDIERYIAVMAYGSDINDDNLVIKYGSEVMKIQQKSSSHAQSPFVEFALYQSYINKEDLNEALDVIKSLNKVDLSSSDRARQKYLLGSVYEKLWRGDEAQKAYQEAIDADATSAWAKLAKGAMQDYQ